MIHLFLIIFIVACAYGAYLKIMEIKAHLLPITAINKAKDGYIAIKGNISNKNNLLKAPLTGKECCWYKFEITKRSFDRKQDGNETENWKSVRDGSSFNFLIIDDGSDQCIVSTLYASVYTDRNEKWRNSTIPDFELTQEEIQIKKYLPTFIANAIDDRIVSANKEQDKGVLNQIKNQLPGALIGSLIGLKQSINIDFRSKINEPLFELSETRLLHNDLVTVYGQQKRLSQDEIKQLINEEEKPFRKDILQALLNFMVHNKINSSSTIFYLIKGQQMSISTLSHDKLIKKDLIALAICIFIVISCSYLLTVI